MARPSSPLEALTEPAPASDGAAVPSGWRRWLQRHGRAASPSGLALARREFVASLGDLPLVDVQALRRLLEAAGSLRELWYLRPEVFRTIALHRSEGEAQRRVHALDRHFARRFGPSGFGPA
ncbi:MAG TPA: hypothetical protein VFQ16_05005 [Burkholderiaceae bacterium]|nr:hypothetical protein [Burkholderiaceae bacterium]